MDARNSHGLTPLHLAVCGGKVGCVQALVEGGADVNATSRCVEIKMFIKQNHSTAPVLTMILFVDLAVPRYIKLHISDALNVVKYY